MAQSISHWLEPTHAGIDGWGPIAFDQPKTWLGLTIGSYKANAMFHVKHLETGRQQESLLEWAGHEEYRSWPETGFGPWPVVRWAPGPYSSGMEPNLVVRPANADVDSPKLSP